MHLWVVGRRVNDSFPFLVEAFYATPVLLLVGGVGGVSRLLMLLLMMMMMMLMMLMLLLLMMMMMLMMGDGDGDGDGGDDDDEEEEVDDGNDLILMNPPTFATGNGRFCVPMRTDIHMWE